MQTLTRAELSEALVQDVGLSRSDSAELVDQILDLMINALSRGETVKVSSFGTFQIRHKRPRMGRNPKTGEEALITERRVVTFRPSHILKSLVNGEKPRYGDDDE